MLSSPHCMNLGPNRVGLRRGCDSKSEELGFRGSSSQPLPHHGREGWSL